MALVGLILTLDTDVAGRVKEFLALAKDIDRILDDQIQPSAREGFLAATRAAEQAALTLIDRIKQARLQRRLFKTGGRLIRYARHFILQLAESWPRAT